MTCSLSDTVWKAAEQQNFQAQQLEEMIRASRKTRWSHRLVILLLVVQLPHSRIDRRTRCTGRLSTFWKYAKECDRCVYGCFFVVEAACIRVRSGR
jgi:hypothetical protein